MKDVLLAWARSHGYLVAWGPLAAVDTARRDLAARRQRGELNADFAQANLSFNYKRPAAATPAWRVVVVVLPRPAHQVTFTVGGRQVHALLPPTYVRYRALFSEVCDDLARCLGSRVEVIDAPLKTLAAYLGLVCYGRNNITYAPGIGSYFQLVGCVTDAALPVPSDWAPQEPRLLDLCESCGACEFACPAGAIGSERVLVRAERCLTLANESGGAFPAWLPASAHHCLIGCLLCQQVCPENPRLEVEETGVLFTAEETAALLAGASDPVGPTWEAIREKLGRLGRSEDTIIGRNLGAMLLAAGHAEVEVGT
jgi:epoxyqueuosine reductase